MEDWYNKDNTQSPVGRFETPSCTKGKEQCVAYFQHFNLTSALEAEEKYKIVERKLREDYEKKLIKNVKQNPSRFFAYLRNKKKSNETVSCLRTANGQTTTCPKETADLLVESLVVGLQQR